MTHLPIRREEHSGGASVTTRAQEPVMSTPARGRPRTSGPVPYRRWECACTPTPTLLGVVDDTGCVNLKTGDRYWHVTGGRIEALCPRCGTRHVLEAAAQEDGGDEAREG
jgi:hypothetical protein